MAFHFAKVLEYAAVVFGTQVRAEKWLCQPSRHLSGKAPLQVIDTSIGAAVVERYLGQIHNGVYV
jgi:putative toxin-antitoxin system antitoxin component (TIGR02293 family)